MDAYNASWQPSWPDKTVDNYKVYYDKSMEYNHKSGRIVLYFTDGETQEIGLFKFKRYLRRRFHYNAYWN